MERVTQTEKATKDRKSTAAAVTAAGGQATIFMQPMDQSQTKGRGQ